MWNLLKKRNEECARFQDELDTWASSLVNRDMLDDILAKLPLPQREHAAGCAECRVAVEDFLQVREMLKRVSRGAANTENTYFSGRVMTAIAAKEAELNGPVGTWIALPRLASRLALAACAILLVGSTWLYQRPRSVQQNQPTLSGSPEYLFEAPPAPPTQDDVLVSLAESNQ
jgi:hypothetical protein